MYLDDMLVMAKNKMKLESHSSDNISSRVAGFCGQQGEVPTDASSGDPVSWIHGGFQRYEDQADRREGNTHLNDLQEGKREGIHISERINQIDWQDDGNSSCNSPSPAVVQRAKSE